MARLLSLGRRRAGALEKAGRCPESSPGFAAVPSPLETVLKRKV